MRILFIATGFRRVGGFIRYMGLARGLTALGHQVDVILGQKKFSFRPCVQTVNGINLHNVPYLGGIETMELLTDYMPETKLPLDVVYRTIITMQRSTEYDVIHAFDPGFNVAIPFVFASLRSKGPLMVYDWCDLWDNGIITPPESGFLRRLDYRLTVGLEPLVHRYADGITVVSKFLYERALRFGLSPDQVSIIGCGADVETIRECPIHEARRLTGLDSTSFLIGFSGFFNPDAAILAMTMAALRKTEPDAKLLYLGPISPHFDSLVRKFNLSDVVIQVGSLPHTKVGMYLSACNLFILPFTGKPLNIARWPIKLGDYLAAGRPVVAGNHGEVGSFFSAHPGIGITCDDTPESFANSIISLKNNPLECEQVGKQARIVAVSALSWTDKAKETQALYDRLQPR